MENLRTIFLYIEGATERGTFPTSQAGTNPLFNFSRDSQAWGGGHYWFWNLRMQLAANLGAGNADFNLPRFRLYRDNLDDHPQLDDAADGHAPRHLRAGDDALRRHRLVHGHRRGQLELRLASAPPPRTGATSPPAPRSA